jgi:phosphatidate cytidylyltransferase
MNRDLLYRIATSLALLPILIFCLHYSGLYFTIFLGLVYLLSFYEIIKNTKNLLFNLISNAILIFAFYSFYQLRGESNYSLINIYWILSTTFFSDIGGYTVGKLFKGKKITKISPNKTYSGLVGSFFFSTLSIPLINLFQIFFYDLNIINFYQLKYLLLAILISIVCQLGDLYVSFWKRKINIKDISNILPGHGGVLDRIDGLIFVLIFIFIVEKIGII